MVEVTQADRDAAIDLDELHIIQVWNIDRVAAAFAGHRQTATKAQAAEIERLREALTTIRDRKWNTMTQGCDAACEAAHLARAALAGKAEQ